VSDEFRVTVRLADAGHGGRLLRALHEHEVEDEARALLGDRVAVSGEGDDVFLYADTEQAAREAQRIVTGLLSAHDLSGEFALDRWHHEEERWEDAAVPLPGTPEAHSVEHERLEEEEASESRASGLAEWEVRIELASHHDARALARRLEQEGFTSVVRRWKYLVVGSDDRDDAEALATRLQSELPAGATIQVEPGAGLAWEGNPRNPFAVFGGLGG